MVAKTICLTITDSGDVLFEGKSCSAQRGTRGYYTVRLPLHRVVATAFHGPSPSAKHVCHHKDGNPRNNSAKNLRWLTQAENTRLHFAGKTRKLTHKQVMDILGKKPAQTASLADLADAFGVSYGAVMAIRSGINWKRGARRSNRAILTEGQIRQVREWTPPVVTAAMLARKYKVSDALILNIWHGRY